MIRFLVEVVSACFKVEERLCEFFAAFSQTRCGLAVLYFVCDVIAYFDRPSLNVYQFLMVISRCTLFIKISACVAEGLNIFSFFTCCVEIRNHVKLLPHFRHSSYDVYRKFPIYFAAVFLSYLRWGLSNIYISKILDLYFRCFLSYLR